MAGLPLLMLFWLLPPNTAKKTQILCASQKRLIFQNQWEYYSPGDLIIGGNLLLTASMFSIPRDFQNDPFLLIHKYSPITKNYQHFMAFVFAVREVNKDLVLLPNITLGFHIYGNYQTERNISIISLSLLSTRGRMAPSYKCDRQDSLLSVIGGDNPKSSKQMASDDL